MISERRTLMAVFAHPDDESFGTGATLARYGADPEVRVVLVCATRGEEGEIRAPGKAIPQTLGQVREQELRCACATLGVEALHFLDYRDSGMASSASSLHPRSLVQAQEAEVVGKIVYHIRRERPDVVITFNDTGGASGHPDHVTIHHRTVAAFYAAGDPTRYPQQIEAGLAAHRPHKLYATAVPRRFFQAVAQRMVALGRGDHPRVQRFLREPFGLPDDACTTDVAVVEFWDVKQAALLCHATQLNPESIFAALPPEEMRHLQTHECFQLLESDVGLDDEGDLMAGLR
jgi:LmbE family N-acetylglucosaminyl deacetylase